MLNLLVKTNFKVGMVFLLESMFLESDRSLNWKSYWFTVHWSDRLSNRWRHKYIFYYFGCRGLWRVGGGRSGRPTADVRGGGRVWSCRLVVIYTPKRRRFDVVLKK